MNKKEAIEKVRSDSEKALSMLESLDETDGSDFWERLAKSSSVSLELATKEAERMKAYSHCSRSIDRFLSSIEDASPIDVDRTVGRK